ncbi:TetR/AcrR family transcriptional regulator [Cognatishimia sp.]|uniref:TetR/AcrR family transcriptional regulator n=1 Tax=Cognatishimia sp. TaxID=2211648 RepID=UPI003517AE01
MNTHSPIARKGRKVDQVLAGAREVFMRDGFEGASVDEIAKVSGVSKATLYSYFTDKRRLFQEVIQAECDRMSGEIEARIDPTAPTREALQTAAYGLTSFLVSRFAQRVFRICLAERDRFPELSQTYFENGPKNGHDQLVLHLRAAAECGELKIDNIDMAAYQFTELCKADLFVRAAFGVESDFSQEEIALVAEEAVETFMARYGA